MISEKICKLKLHKAGGHDSIQNENVVHAGSSLAIHLSLLFNAMLRHSFVPDDFRIGITKPLPKVKHGDLYTVVLICTEASLSPLCYPSCLNL